MMGKRPTINAGLAQLIRDYRAAVAEAVDLLVRSGIPRPSSNYEWVGTVVPQSGKFVGEIGYFSHGFGCSVDLPSGSVDFDFGEHGEIDLFDFGRLNYFAKGRLSHYGFSSERAL